MLCSVIPTMRGEVLTLFAWWVFALSNRTQTASFINNARDYDAVSSVCEYESICTAGGLHFLPIDLTMAARPLDFHYVPDGTLAVLITDPLPNRARSRIYRPR